MGKIEVCINRPGLATILKLADALKIEPFELLKFDTLCDDALCRAAKTDAAKNCL